MFYFSLCSPRFRCSTKTHSPPFYSTSSLLILSSLPPPLPCMFLLSSPPCCHPTSFPFFNNNRLPQGFSFHFVMILTLLPFCHFPPNKETSRTNIFFYILTPLQDENDLGLNFNLKSGEVPPPKP